MTKLEKYWPIYEHMIKYLFLSLTHLIMMEKEQDNKNEMKDDINETVEVEKDDTSDINEDRQTSFLKKTLAFLKTWSCLLTSILLLIITIMCLYYFAVTTSPPDNLTEQGNKVQNASASVQYFEAINV